jgi:hypothetical protein
VHAKATDEQLLENLRVITPERLARIHFLPSHSLRLFEFEYPVNRYVQACFDRRAVAIPTAEKTRVAIARRDANVWRLDLERNPFELLSRLAGGQPLEEALCGIDATADELREWFSTWAECGLFRGVDEAPQTRRIPSNVSNDVTRDL